MMNFYSPLLLLLLIPWGITTLVLMRSQLKALVWLLIETDSRFSRILTRSTPTRLRSHFVMLFVMGALLIIAAAGPWVIGTGEMPSDDSTIIFVIDASLSMIAPDVEPHPLTGEELSSRFAAATHLCLDIIDLAQKRRYGLISFSGTAIIHAPPSNDIHALKTVLKTMRNHYYSQSMGSSFSAAFDKVIHLTNDRYENFQIVLLSDGEISKPDDFDDPLDILSSHSIPVHTVAIGSRTWQDMNIYVLEDVLANAEEKRIAGEFRTRRDHKTLQKMSAATGGESFIVDDDEWAEDIETALQSAQFSGTRLMGERKKDLSPYLLALFLVCLGIEWLVFSPKPPPSRTQKLPWRHRHILLIIALSATVFSSGCRAPLLRAHVNNEDGLEKQGSERHKEALVSFERSAAFHVREQIPSYNRGNSLLSIEDFSSAHDAYQRAIVLKPDMREAFFNDGQALYLWGEREIDPAGCELERTRALWEQAERRFVTATEISGMASPLGIRAAENRTFVETRLSELDALAENCLNNSPDPPPDQNETTQPEQNANEGEGTHEPPPSQAGLTPEERKQIESELERIRAQAENSSTFRQTKEMQLPPDKATGEDGRKIWW